MSSETGSNEHQHQHHHGEVQGAGQQPTSGEVQPSTTSLANASEGYNAAAPSPATNALMTTVAAATAADHQYVPVLNPPRVSNQTDVGLSETGGAKGISALGSAKHHLPLFLSKTYHMIEKSDPEIVTWSELGDNFIVKNVEKFSSVVLPQYFKHSNFASFCRQLNFYGFRKLKSEPILNADFDSKTADYVRFYHEKFKRDRPDLLLQMKRTTTKSQPEHHSKDDVDSLRLEISNLRELLTHSKVEYERKLAEVVADSHGKFSQLWNELSRLSKALHSARGPPSTMPMIPPPTQSHPHFSHMGAYMPSPAYVIPTLPVHDSHAKGTEMMQSLSHVAGVKLQSPSVQSQKASNNPKPMTLTESTVSGTKRNVDEKKKQKQASSKKIKTDQNDSEGNADNPVITV